MGLKGLVAVCCSVRMAASRANLGDPETEDLDCSHHKDSAVHHPGMSR